jgi:hypothetical protein
VGGQALADGRNEPSGWQWALVLGLLIVYTLAIVGVGVGVMLLCDLFKHPPYQCSVT